MSHSPHGSDPAEALLAEYERADARQCQHSRIGFNYIANRTVDQKKLDLFWAHCMATLRGRKLYAAHQEFMCENGEWLTYMHNMRARMVRSIPSHTRVPYLSIVLQLGAGLAWPGQANARILLAFLEA